MNNVMLSNLTDRQILELIYILLLLIYNRVSEIDNDDKLFNMNVLANLVGDALMGERR